MDTDKDGLLSSSDLVAAFAAHGKNIGGALSSRAFTGPGLVPRSRVLRLVPGPGYWAGPGSTGTETLKKGQKPRFRGNFGNDF